MQLIILIVVMAPGVVVMSYLWHIRRLLEQKSKSNPPQSVLPISVIVPCRGLEEHPTENIEALLAQVFRTPAEILFCVESRDDPVVAILESLLLQHQNDSARLVITGEAGGDLGKMHNLLVGDSQASGHRLIFLDSDVRLPDPEYLQRFVAELNDPEVGLVTCYPAYRHFRNIPAAMTSLAINNDLLGLFALVGNRGKLSLANGSCLAVDRAALSATGGLTTLRRQLLMDSSLAVNILRAGYRVVLHPEAAPVTAGRMTASQMFLQSRRWHVGMWCVLPRLHYLGYAWLRAGFLMGMIVGILTGFDAAVVVALVFILAARGLVSCGLDRRYLHSGSLSRYWWLLPVVELFNGLEVLMAPLVKEVGWRGRTYRVDQSGRIKPVLCGRPEGERGGS